MAFVSRDAVWLVGSKGRLARALERRLSRNKYTVITTDVELDVADHAKVMAYAEQNRPRFIVNCAGYAVQQGKDIDSLTAYRINALGARNLAIAAEMIGATLVHFSTDDIFEGERTAHNEFDSACPRTVYAKSKLAGESMVRALCPRHIIVRSSWVYTALPYDMINKAVCSAIAKEPMEVAMNQFAAPTSVETVATFILKAMEADQFGTFHVTDKGITSRYNFLSRALRNLGLTDDYLIATNKVEDGFRVELENLMLQITGAYDTPTWEEDLKEYMAAHTWPAEEEEEVE